ncbi:hypothetical protein [Halovenus halobia]|uniref:hypothetical protein n=1 Tax=Halovenus halobia TaxID=3396622 RepID=UPI003F56EBBF
MSLPALNEKGSSETIGVAVLVGMTILVTAGLGLGVLVMGQQQQQQTADVDFTFLGEKLVVIYEDSTDRPAGRLFVQGTQQNMSWAELDDSKEPSDMVTENDNVRLQEDSAWGTRADPNARYDLVFITEEGERFVLASVNDGGSGSSSGSSGGPGGSDRPSPPG